MLVISLFVFENKRYVFVCMDSPFASKSTYGALYQVAFQISNWLLEEACSKNSPQDMVTGSHFISTADT